HRSRRGPAGTGRVARSPAARNRAARSRRDPDRSPGGREVVRTGPVARSRSGPAGTGPVARNRTDPVGTDRTARSRVARSRRGPDRTGPGRSHTRADRTGPPGRIGRSRVAGSFHALLRRWVVLTVPNHRRPVHSRPDRRWIWCGIVPYVVLRSARVRLRRHHRYPNRALRYAP